ncbi:MAG: archaeal proteasome endopeptidase complex subunit beta [Methanomicrobiaceae archaeon]|nr:archaeal proteasome endopeptidase complex subunit beta [Methanomicrobiaceae archaeon]
MPDLSEQIYKGTTTVGLVFDNGVVLATEKRATMGNMIASKRAKKVYQITKRIGMTTAGGVGDAQQLARIMQVETRLFDMRRGKTMTVGAVSTLLSNYLNQNRFYPYYVQLLVGGVDESGPSIYSVDALGGATREEEIVATGSGSPFAYGVLEDQYRVGMNEKEAVEIAVRALRSAMRRDIGSGEDIQIVVITPDKYEEIEESGIQKPSVARSTT